MIKSTDNPAAPVTRLDVLACPPGKHVTFSGGDLRNVLTHGFSADELTAFSARYFPAARDPLSADLTQAQQAQALIDYCVQHYRTTDLSELIILARPDAFRPELVETIRKARHLLTRSERLRRDLIRLAALVTVVVLAGVFPGAVLFLSKVTMIVGVVALVGLGLLAVWWWCRPKAPEAAPREAGPPGSSLLRRIEQTKRPTDLQPHDNE